MESRRHERESITGDAPRPESAGRATNIERIVTGLIENLPLVDKNALEAAVAEVKERPRISLHYLFQNFAAADPRIRAAVGRILAGCGGSDVVDNLNAIIFDGSQAHWTQVLANDMLEQLGSPVDPDVFAMSVPDAEALQHKLPSRALKLLAKGDIAGAVQHTHGMEAPYRYSIMADAAARQKDKAVAFLEALASEGEDNTIAAVSVIGEEKLAAGVPFLQALTQSPNRAIQKLVKRTLFEMRKAGIEIPEEKKDLSAPTPKEGSEEPLPLYRTMMSAPSREGLVLVAVARRRPDGRLKVFSVLVDLWKRGIKQAGSRLEMSKSAFEKFLSSQAGSRLVLKDSSLNACLRIIGRGVCVAKEFGTPIPVDFGLGKAMLGDLDGEVAEITNPFLCSICEAPLDEETVKKIRDVAPYENIPPETRCEDCRKKR